MLRVSTALVCAAFSFACSAAETQPSSNSLTLAEAFARVERTHPSLAGFAFATRKAEAERDVAALRPQYEASLSVENALGTGEARGLTGAEVTLALSSVFERGGKREARIRVAEASIGVVDPQREAQRLDLFAEVARRALEAAVLDDRAAIGAEALRLRARATEAARERVNAGAGSPSALASAEAAQARAELALSATELAALSARRRLAMLWGAKSADFEKIDVDVYRLREVAAFDELAATLDRTPELQRFASEERLREARVELARSARVPDLSWSVGLRRIEATSDWGLVAEASLPLNQSSRAEPGIRAAVAEREALALERETATLTLFGTLAEAHGRILAAQHTERTLRERVIPALERAMSDQERAYRAGQASYLEWSQAQAEWVAAREERLAAAESFSRALLEIERLTGSTWFAADGEAQ